MRILILGGTKFLGRHLVEAARHHEITLFNRGTTNPDLFPEVEKLRGDRDGNLEALRGRKWDAVIDTCGYVPRIVRMSVEALAGIHYTFISTVSVYKDWNEAAGLATLADPTTEQITGDTYGGLKVLCEKTGPPLVIRPGLIVGPHDPSDRFTYWPARVRRGGRIVAPGRPHRKIQYIDVRDLAEWTIRLVEKRATGSFNAITPPDMLTMRQFLDECGGGDLLWVDEKTLADLKVAPYSEMPLWIPDVDDRFNATDALAAGLTYRPLRRTIADTLEWDATRPPGPRKNGLSEAREAEIIKVFSSKVDSA